MIQINCTNCKALLQIDDAFAGGVCRCRYCGTIQTVPKHLKNAANGNGESTVAAVEQAAASAKSAKSLYKKTAIDSSGSGTGLDDLASIVASSGLSSGRLQKKSGANAAAAAAAKPSPANDRRLLIIVASAGAVIALLLGIIIFMAVRDKTSGNGSGAPTNGNENQNNTAPVRNDNPTPGSPNNTVSANPAPPATFPPRKRIPNFLGHPLTESDIAYVIDRGASSNTEARLDLLKPALINSVRSLGPNRKFQVILWQVQGQSTPVFPKDGMGPAFGQTKGPHAMEKAYKLNPQAIVLVPIKGILREDDEDFATAMMKPRGNSTAKVYSFTLAQTALSAPLREIANQTNGAYHDVPLDDLRNAGYEQ
jgi:hypothetical protein